MQQMSHGYYINVPTRSEYHYGVLYTEARVGSLIAIGKGDVPRGALVPSHAHLPGLARLADADAARQA